MKIAALLKIIKRAENYGMSLFYSAEAHKDEMLLREIVTEHGLWEGALSRYFQKHLRVQQFDGSYL